MERIKKEELSRRGGTKIAYPKGLPNNKTAGSLFMQPR